MIMVVANVEEFFVVVVLINKYKKYEIFNSKILFEKDSFNLK